MILIINLLIVLYINPITSINTTYTNLSTTKSSTTSTQLPDSTNIVDLFATINPEYQVLIQDIFLPSDYVLPTNIYLWNVSELVHYINASDPKLLYVIDTAYLIEIFPEYFLKQLPRDILISHDLYYLLPTNDSSFCANCSNITHIASSCVFPFVKTKYDTYFKWNFEDLNSSFQCGLLCEYGDVLWGIHPEDQRVTDIFLYVSSIIFLLMIIIVWINQCMDLRLSQDERCCHRGFLFHAPICLICFYTFVALCFLIPVIIGKSNVVCAQDIDNNLTVSMKNPGGSIICTIVGSLFYAATLLFGLYTMGFSFILWRQFFSPLQSLWSTLKTYYICCPCAVCMDHIILPVIRPCIYCIESNKMLTKMASSTSASSVNIGRVKTKRRPITCGDVFCSATTYGHYTLWSIAIIMTMTAISEDSVDAFSPLGICTVGGQEESSMLKYNVVPFTIVFMAATFFVPFAIYLLAKVANYSSNMEQRKMMRNLGTRILWYFICQEICWIFVCEVSWVFYDKRPLILEAAEKRMFCLTYRAATGDVDKCYEGYSLWSGLYIQMALTLPLAGVGSIFISCHSKNRKRWKIICNTINDFLHCKQYQHKSSVVDRLHADNSELQSSFEDKKYRKGNKDTSSTTKSTAKRDGGQVSPGKRELIPDVSPTSGPIGSPSDTQIEMADL